MRSAHASTSRSAAAVVALVALLSSTANAHGTPTHKHPSPVKRQTSSCYSGYAATPLASKHYDYPDGIPYMVDDDDTACRGHQVGYNICNSTTEGADSMCQTTFVNSIDDFCLWAPSEPNSTVADVEGEMVAWCTKPGRGTRIIPEGALQGVQFLRAPAYVAVTGFIDQSMINIVSDDSGGEEDPHGADGKGNPMGSLMYSQAFSGGNISDSTAWEQVIEWHNFMGGNMFCIKACDPSNANAADFCQHVFDRVGCAYNVPAAYVNGTFESCESDNQMYPGVYVGTDNVTSTYTQPAESLGAITTMPYTPVVPSSSQCTTFTSASLFTALASANPATTSSSSAATSGSSSSGSKSASSSSKTSGVAANAAASSSSSGTGAGSHAASTGFVGVAGVVVFTLLGAALL